MALFRHAEFETSVARPDQLPFSSTPEVAFAGRSNAGKSSALNTLADHTRLAFVSKTPGRTQLINLFRLRNGAAMVDLPGYGYADVPLSVREQWQGLLEGYLTRRPNLAGLVLIMDARRPFTDLDRQMVKWFATTGRPIHCLLTKADKLTRTEQAKTLKAAKEVAAAMLGQISLQLFSSLKKSGVEEAEQVIGPWFDNWTAAQTEQQASETPPASDR
jgi:GTP-binding protein